MARINTAVADRKGKGREIDSPIDSVFAPSLDEYETLDIGQQRTSSLRAQPVFRSQSVKTNATRKSQDTWLSNDNDSDEGEPETASHHLSAYSDQSGTDPWHYAVRLLTSRSGGVLLILGVS